MSSISALSAGNRAYAATDTTSASRVPQKALGQEDFLQLLAAQFQAQDPMKPMEDTTFIAQMAQFSALESSSAMAKEISAMHADTQRATANSYLGHRVTVDTGSGKSVTGDVSAIDVSGTTPRLMIDGKPYTLSAVLRVEPGVVSAPAPQPANAGGA